MTLPTYTHTPAAGGDGCDPTCAHPDHLTADTIRDLDTYLADREAGR